MSADDPGGPPFLGPAERGALEPAGVAALGLAPLLEARDGPSAEPARQEHRGPAGHGLEHRGQSVPELAQPDLFAHERVEAIPVQDDEAPPVGGFVFHLLRDPELGLSLSPGRLEGSVVVARQVGNARSLRCLVADGPQHFPVTLRPRGGSLRGPAIHDVTHHVEEARLDPLEKAGQLGGPAAPRPQMDVGHEDRAEAEGVVPVGSRGSHGPCIGHRAARLEPGNRDPKKRSAPTHVWPLPSTLHSFEEEACLACP